MFSFSLSLFSLFSFIIRFTFFLHVHCPISYHWNPSVHCSDRHNCSFTLLRLASRHLVPSFILYYLSLLFVYVQYKGPCVLNCKAEADSPSFVLETLEVSDSTPRLRFFTTVRLISSTSIPVHTFSAVILHIDETRSFAKLPNHKSFDACSAELICVKIIVSFYKLKTVSSGYHTVLLQPSVLRQLLVATLSAPA